MLDNRKDAFLIARIPSQLKDKLKELSTSVGLTLSEYCRRILEKGIHGL